MRTKSKNEINISICIKRKAKAILLIFKNKQSLLLCLKHDRYYIQKMNDGLDCIRRDWFDRDKNRC